jgi:ankyrin repeat protein
MEVVRCLLKLGADVNHALESVPPLMVASYNKHAEVVKLLIEAGADPQSASNIEYIKTPPPAIVEAHTHTHTHTHTHANTHTNTLTHTHTHIHIHRSRRSVLAPGAKGTGF